MFVEVQIRSLVAYRKTLCTVLDMYEGSYSIVCVCVHACMHACVDMHFPNVLLF